MTVGLVCEGHTDVPILEALLRRVCDGLGRVRAILPPEEDQTFGPGRVEATGYLAVKQWCAEHRRWLREFVECAFGEPFDLLVIHLDGDIHRAIGATPPGPNTSAADIGSAVAAKVLNWLGCTDRRPLPRSVLLCIPVMATETWIYAALYDGAQTIELAEDPAVLLVARHHLARGEDGKPIKDLQTYRGLAPKVAEHIGNLRATCPQADRFLSDVERRREQCLDAP